MEVSMSELDRLVGKYPCMLCTENFLTKDAFDEHFSACVRDISATMTSLEQEVKNANSQFAKEGSEMFKLKAEQCQVRFQDIKYRLGLFGFKRCAGGWISPAYSNYFSTTFCGYCNEGFPEHGDLLEHKDKCFRMALSLKNMLHQSVKNLEKEVETDPHNVLKDNAKQLNEGQALISYKLLIHDGVALNDYIL